MQSEQGARIDYFDADCSEDERHECGIAALTCLSPMTIGFELFSVPSTTLGKWLIKADYPSLRMTSEGKTTTINLTSVATNDMDGGWYVTFSPYMSAEDLSPSDWFAGLARRPAISLMLPDGDITVLPSSGADGAALVDFLEACGGP